MKKTFSINEFIFGTEKVKPIATFKQFLIFFRSLDDKSGKNLFSFFKGLKHLDTFQIAFENGKKIYFLKFKQDEKIYRFSPPNSPILDSLLEISKQYIIEIDLMELISTAEHFELGEEINSLIETNIEEENIEVDINVINSLRIASPNRLRNALRNPLDEEDQDGY